MEGFLQEMKAPMPRLHPLCLQVVVRGFDLGQRATSAVVSRQGFARTMLEEPT